MIIKDRLYVRSNGKTFHSIDHTDPNVIFKKMKRVNKQFGDQETRTRTVAGT